MKKILILIIGVLAIFLSSCSDVKELNAGYDSREYTNSGAPVISAIFDVQDTGFVSPLTAGVLNQFIRITGKNLANPKEITIDGLEVDIPTRTFSKNGESYIRIPRYVPETQNGKLTYVTDQGKAEVDFTVGIPAVELDGLVNEFMKPGASAQLAGDYFDLYNFGDTTETSTVSIMAENAAEGYSKKLKCDSCIEGYTSIFIPADCPDNTMITFQYQNMAKETIVKKIKYRPVENILYGNFDGDMGWWNDDGKAMVTTGANAGEPESLGFNYLRLKNTFGSWAWWSTGWGCGWPLELNSLDELDDYYMKFEIYTDPAYPYYSYSSDNSGYDHGGYEFTLMGCANRYQFNPIADAGIANTNGKWVTYRIPLHAMMISLEAVPAVGTWCNFEFVCQPNNDDGWTVDHCFGQFRIEPKEYK